MKVLLDTNFLLVPHQFGVDIFEFLSLYDIATLDLCVKELKKLGRKNSKDSAAARIGLKLIKDRNVEIIKSKEKKADLAILKYALKEKCTVATNDKKLIKDLKRYGIKIIRLRQNKYLIEE